MPYTDIITTYLVEDTGDDTIIHTEKTAGSRYYGVTDLDDMKSYMVSERYKGYRIGVTYPVNTANANIAPMTVVLIIAFLCAFVVINIVVIKSFDALQMHLKKMQRKVWKPE